MFRIFVNICILYYLSTVNCSVNIQSNLKIKNVDRLIDISSQIVKITNKITIENAGREAITYFIFTVDPKFAQKVAVIKARISNSDNLLPLSEVELNSEKVWHIKLDNTLNADKFIVLDVYYSLIDYLKPYPTHIAQSEKQFVKFNGNCYFYSPYHVSKVTTTVATGTKYVENYSKVEPFSYSDTHILYGPYKDVSPFSSKEIEIHYENNSPFLIVSKLERRIEISHWGNLAIEEEITLEHTGAKLKGPFSRYDYQREPESGSSSVKSFKTILPATASDVYYRDEIGNISTSHLYILENSVEVELRPRFPLFGGWNTQYLLGYNLPSYSYLYTKGDNYLLKMPLIDHIFDNMIIKEATVKIILPEGSHSIELILPYHVERLPDSLYYAFLDTIGRPVVTITKNDLIEDHIDHFELRYAFPKMYMLLEPLLIIMFLFILFLSVLFYVRLDFSLSKDEISEQKLRVSGLCSKIVFFYSKKIKLYQNFEEKLTTAKFNKDLNNFNNNIKSFNNEYKNLTAQISEFNVKLKVESPDLIDKFTEIQKIDKQIKEIYNQQQSVYIEKLIPGKITKALFVEQENNFSKKKEEYFNKINKVLRGIE